MDNAHTRPRVLSSVLRSSRLSSLIWMYRTRTGVFAIDDIALSAEERLCRYLSEWREELLGGCDLSLTDLPRAYPPHVYTHHQYPGSGEDYLPIGADDHYSPVNPQKYINLRLWPALEFYQARLPGKVRLRLILQVITLLCSAASAVAASVKPELSLSFVPIISALSAAVVSWMEFTSLSTKLERYTSCIKQLKNLHSW